MQEITSEDYKADDDSITSEEDSYADKTVGTRYIYAQNGNLAKEINRLDVTTYYQYFENSSIVKTETFDLYKYTYDKNGNILNVYIGGNTNSSGTYTGGDLYAAYNYADDGTLSYITYGNNQTISYEYNNFSQITKQKYKSSPDAEEKTQYEYVYSQNAQDEESSVLKEKYDYESMQKTVYDESGKVSIYCLDNRMVILNSEEDEKFYYSYYESDETTNEQGGKTPGKIEYDCLLNDLSITKKENGYTLKRNNESEQFSYTSQLKDGRLSTESVTNGDDKTILETSYTYNEKGYAESITSKSLDGKETVTSYKYDDKGRITEYTCDGKTVYYTYDSKGQLIREDGRNETIVYSYDKRGNFKSTRAYDYTRGEIETDAIYAQYFEIKYNDTAWLDKITGVDDDEMVYDVMGNLVSLADCTIEWTNGRQFSRFVSNETGEAVFELLYDDNGILTQKTDYEGTTYYTNIDGSFTTQYTEFGNDNLESEQMQFIYDDNNQVTALCYNKAMYYYVKNAMGDVIGIVNENGERVCTYEYDAWGNVVNTYHHNTIGTDYKVGDRNPIRYRSYYYDNSMGFYYLKSRFYMSSMARFLNADVPEIAKVSKNEVNGQNLFAYCNNDPVNYVDYYGYKYNPVNAYKYAEKWWNDYNSNYPEHGNDCASFVSQCLYAGGFSKMTGVNDAGWHYHYFTKNRQQVSDAWGKAAALEKWIKGRNELYDKRIIAKNKTELNECVKKYFHHKKRCIGLIFFREKIKGKEKVTHAAISGMVTRPSNGKNYYMYFYAHTNSRAGDNRIYKGEGKIGVNTYLGPIYSSVIIYLLKY